MTTDNQNTSENPSLRDGVMDAIKKGGVRMRPRWHFVLISALGAIGILIIILTLLYAASLSIFFLHDNGTWFAPSFGGRGWFDLLQSVPWLLVVFILVFIGVLEILVRRYSFVYRRPLMLSVAVILALILVGGFLIAQTPFHRQMEFYARHNALPPPLSFAYGTTLRMPPPPDILHGTILSVTPNTIVVDDENGAGTTTVILDPNTKLPDGDDFRVGEEVVVVGNAVATGTMRAFGIVDADE